MKPIFFAVVATCCSVACAEIVANRYGAVYYPGETATFAVSGTGSWAVTDAKGESLADGTVAGGVVTVSHQALGGKFGAFKLTVGGETTWFAFLRSTMEHPCSWVGTGTHSSFGWQKDPVDFRYLDLVRAAGIGIVRDDVLWESYDKNKGTYTFDDNHNLTLLVNNLRSRGLRFHPVLTGKNNYYADKLDKEAFAAFAAAFVDNFKGAFGTCDIFNEPHNAHFPDVYPGEDSDGKVWIAKHREFTRATVNAIRQADPSFTPGVGVEDYWDFFKKYMLRINNTEVESGLVVAGDLVSLHTYGTSTEVRPEKNYLFVDGGTEVRNALVQYGGGASRIAITEAGWSTYEGADAGAKMPPSTLDEQAAYLVRFYLLARQHGVEFACQYDFMDHADKAGKASRNFGIVREDGTPKPAFGAVAAMTRLVGEATPTGSASSDESTYRFYDFTRGNCSISAAWSLEGTVTVDVPSGKTLTGLHCLDLQGNVIAAPLNGNQLTLTEEPIYFVDGDLEELFPSAMAANVVVEQNPVTHGVTVTYDLLGSEGIVTVAFLTNGVPCETTRHVSGDVWKAVPAGTGKKIAWNPALDLGPENAATYSVAARVSVWSSKAPPTYYVLDLVKANAVTRRRFYEYEGQLPEGIASDVYRTTKMVFRRVPAAGVTFTMGAPMSERNACGIDQQSWSGCETQHQVTFTEDYYLGVFEVTQKQWLTVMGNDTAFTTTESGWKMVQQFPGDTLPVQGISRNRWLCGENQKSTSYTEVVQDDLHPTFFTALRKLAGGTGGTDKRYNLPFEAQWEFACRAGTTTAFSDGREYSGSADYSDIAVYNRSSAGPMRVGSKKPNAWGFYDMHGNVSEVILDNTQTRDKTTQLGGESKAYYGQDQVDPKGVTTAGEGANVAVRGGNYMSDTPMKLRSAFRQNNLDWSSSIGAGGFRVRCPINEL